MRFLLILFLMWHSLYAKQNEADYYAMKKVAYHYFDGGKSRQAIGVVKDFIKKHPKSYRAQNLLAHFYYWTGDKRHSLKILEKVVKKSNLAEAKRLWRRLQKKSPRKVQSSLQKSDTEQHQKDISADLVFLLQYVKSHPFDIENRKFLLHYFISVNAREEAQRMVDEILHIAPDESETLKLVKEFGLRINASESKVSVSNAKMNKIVAMLHSDFVQKRYCRFVNLYNAVVHQGGYLPEYIHLDAVEAAVEMRAFAIARSILLRHDFTPGKHVRQLQALLDQKVFHISEGSTSRL